MKCSACFLACLILIYSCKDKGTVVADSEAAPISYGEPAWGPGGQIVFTHTPNDRNGNPIADSAGLWKINSDGTGKRPLTFHFVGCPRWYRNGEWIAVHSGGQIWKIKASGDSLTQLTFSGGNKYCPDTDSAALAIAYASHAGTPRGIWVFHFAIGLAKLVIPYGYHPNWFSNNEQLLASAFVDGVTKIVVGDSTGGNIRVIFDPTTVGISSSIYWCMLSPDGLRVVFNNAQTGETQSQVWLVNIDGSGIRQLTFDGGMEPSWSPDGNRIVYVRYSRSNRDVGNGKLWIMNSDGSNKTQLTF